MTEEKSERGPWYLLLGPSQAGKSTLIARCTAWFGTDAIFIDAPIAIRKQSKYKLFSGIIWVLDWVQFNLQNKSEQQTLVQNLTQTIADLAKQFNPGCPLYVVFTKIDRVAGFSEFFADLGQEERAQPWGMEFSRQQAAHLSHLFKAQFDRWLKRLYDRVIWRVHQERNTHKRTLIQGFPLQLENSRNRLIELVEQLSGLNSTYHLQGIYFVSNQQQDKPIDFLQQSVAQTIGMSSQKNILVTNQGVAQENVRQQSYFTQQLFKKIILYAATMPASAVYRAHQIRLAMYGAIAAVVIATSVFFAHSLNTKITNINAAEHAVTEYNVLSQQWTPGEHHDLSQILPVLNTLQLAVVSLQQANLPWLVSRQYNVEALAEKTYHEALVAYFLPSLGDLLAQPLANTTDPVMLYGALKTYLMLGDPSHFDAGFIKNWLENYWQQTLVNNPDLQKQLNNHLVGLLAAPIAPLELNQQAINTARHILASAPPLELAYAVLKSRVANDAVMPFASNLMKSHTFTEIFTANNLQIDSFYTATQFQDIYFHKINAACRAVIAGDWILATPHPVSELELVRGLQTYYLQDYANHWLSLLSSIRVVPWKNWQQAQDALNSLLSGQSPLIGLLQTVATNTALDKLIPSSINVSNMDTWNIKTNLSNRFQSFNTLLPEHDTTQSLNGALQKIVQLRDYLTHIADAHDSSKAAFLAAQTRFAAGSGMDAIANVHLTANAVSDPLRHWLNSLADNSWQLILQNAATYLNAQWQAEVLPVYAAQLDNRYPLFKNADTEIALDDFTHFFASDGVLANYFNQYIASFIDTSKTQWQWRLLEGQSIILTPDLVTQLERANIIRTMFFHGGAKPEVSFIMQPIEFEPGVRSFSLTINGQTFVDHADMTTPHPITWPDLSKSPLASFTFTNNQGQQATEVETGAWALFKLLDKANLQSTPNPQRFLLTFDLNGNAAQYQLQSDHIINPFLSGIIEQFRCPPKITP